MNTDMSMNGGINKTGVDMSPVMSRKMLEAASLAEIESVREPTITAADLRRRYLVAGETVGSVPLPVGLKDATRGTWLRGGRQPEVFVDQLGARLGFVRLMVRLYDALILKVERAGLDVERLVRYRVEKLKHFQILNGAMEFLGLDPSAQTPSASAAILAVSGVLQVITDPRMTVAQSVQAMLMVERSDHAAWEILIPLTRLEGLDDCLREFKMCHAEECEHVDALTALLKSLVAAKAGDSVR